MREVEKEQEFNPEAIAGKPLRVPTVVPAFAQCFSRLYLFPNQNFVFRNLHLPPSWQIAIPELVKLAEERTRAEEQNRGKIYWTGEYVTDPKTGLLLKASYFGKKFGKKEVHLKQDGEYQTSGIDDLNDAFEMKRIVEDYLEVITERLGLGPYPEIPGVIVYQGEGKLTLPQSLLKDSQPLLTAGEKEDISNKISEISKKYYLRAKPTVQFDEKGLLTSIKIDPNGGMVLWEPSDGNYQCIDKRTIGEAVILHYSLAYYINYLLEKRGAAEKRERIFKGGQQS